MSSCDDVGVCRQASVAAAAGVVQPADGSHPGGAQAGQDKTGGSGSRTNAYYLSCTFQNGYVDDSLKACNN